MIPYFIIAFLVIALIIGFLLLVFITKILGNIITNQKAQIDCFKKINECSKTIEQLDRNKIDALMEGVHHLKLLANITLKNTITS